jgi:ArsR family transcriptional regulator, zinc-responsive transcriptional repressor
MTADSGTPTHDAGTPARRSRVAVEAPTPIPHDPYPYRAPAAPAVPSRPVLDNAGELLRALAAPVRIAIVLQLLEGGRCVHELVDALGVTQPLISQHLRVLKSAGVVDGERHGREVVYRLVDDHLSHIVVDAVTHVEEE